MLQAMHARQRKISRGVYPERAEGLEMLLGHISRATSVDDLVVTAVQNNN